MTTHSRSNSTRSDSATDLSFAGIPKLIKSQSIQTKREIGEQETVDYPNAILRRWSRQNSYDVTETSLEAIATKLDILLSRTTAIQEKIDDLDKKFVENKEILEKFLPNLIMVP